MTGIFAQIGKDMENGFQMYLDEQKGNFAGAKVTFIVEDEEGKPPVGVRKAEKLAPGQRAHAGRGLLASTGYAIAPVSSRLKTVYVLSIAAADDLTQRDLDKFRTSCARAGRARSRTTRSANGPARTATRPSSPSPPTTPSATRCSAASRRRSRTAAAW